MTFSLNRTCGLLFILLVIVPIQRSIEFLVKVQPSGLTFQLFNSDLILRFMRFLAAWARELAVLPANRSLLKGRASQPNVGVFVGANVLNWSFFLTVGLEGKGGRV